MIKRIIFGLLTSIIYLNSLAQSIAPNTTSASTFTATAEAHYCPALNELTLDSKTRIWSASGDWKSYEQSFAKDIGQFLGAQWIGIEVGQIACIYQGKNQYTFPILLIHNTLVKTPSGGAWTKDANSGHYHCATHQISQCPFHPITKSQAASSSNAENFVDTIPHNPVQSQMNF
jgi:hypothetical protein